MTNETQDAAEIAIAQTEANRWSAYQDQKEVVRRADLAAACASDRYFANGETPGDLVNLRRCIAVASRAYAKLLTI